MRLRCAFELIIGPSLVLGVGLGVAGELADFNGAVEAAASHHRAVLGQRFPRGMRIDPGSGAGGVGHSGQPTARLCD